MVQLQIISKLLTTSDFSIIEDNLLTRDYFVGYTTEFDFIVDHHHKYGNVPDKATFLSRFPDLELVDVTESDKYLVDTIREEYLYEQSVPVIKKAAELLKVDSNAASEYLSTQLSALQPSFGIGGVDIISQATERFDHFEERRAHQDDWFFESGFKELDDIIHGLQRGEEFVVIVARTNQGKSWVLEKMCAHVWQTGYNVGYLSPEMSADSIGFRFDTLFRQFSNKSLMWGKDDIEVDSYKSYIDELQAHKNKFMVTTPLDFDHQVTVTKLKQWVKQNKLDMIAIDGITYLTDERGNRGDNKTTSLTHISEDLMSLSVELKIPILTVVQANRNGVVGSEEDDGTPELESIRDSDGIAHNASKVISIRQKKNGVLEMGIKKQRFGAVGGKLNYTWDIDKGDFLFIPSFDDAEPQERTKKKVDDVKRQFKGDKSDVF